MSPNKVKSACMIYFGEYLRYYTTVYVNQKWKKESGLAYFVTFSTLVIYSSRMNAGGSVAKTNGNIHSFRLGL